MATRSNNFEEFVQHMVETRVRCGHSWIQTGGEKYPSCPVCKRISGHGKVKVTDEEVIEAAREEEAAPKAQHFRVR